MIDGIKPGNVIWSVLEGKQLIKTAKTIVYPGPQEIVNFYFLRELGQIVGRSDQWLFWMQ